jgi:hypothetical protein
VAFLASQSTLTTLQAGPFISTVDGVTVLSGLTIPPSARRLSVNGGAFVASTALDNAVYLSEGYYRFTLSGADTAGLGLLRVAITMPGALAVWVDVVVVPASVAAMLAGVPATPLLLQQTPALLTLGPFISNADGVTVQSALSIPPAEVQLSTNDGTFTTSTSVAPLLARGDGHYSPQLTAADTAVLGDMRVSITLAGSMPVWMDYTVVDQAGWDLYFSPLPAVIIVPPEPPVPPQPSPWGGRAASSLYAGVSAVLDDPQQLRADEPLLLRCLSQAQQWVALRYHLLIHSFPLDVIAGVPWYALPALQPRLLMVTEVFDASQRMLTAVPLTRLRYSDPQWLARSGPPTRFYRVGWTHLGLYTVPDASASYTMTGVCMPVRLTEGAQLLETPLSYDDAVMRVAAGLLLVGRERKTAKGMALISQGLALPMGQPAEEVPA